jgi:hypothetical protein
MVGVIGLNLSKIRVAESGFIRGTRERGKWFEQKIHR